MLEPLWQERHVSAAPVLTAPDEPLPGVLGSTLISHHGFHGFHAFIVVRRYFVSGSHEVSLFFLVLDAAFAKFPNIVLTSVRQTSELKCHSGVK